MCGNTGKPVKEEKEEPKLGGSSGGFEAPASEGTLGRDQQQKRPSVLLKEGKIMPGTRAYASKKA